jgi:membrane protein involved in colicin uptake
MTFVITNPNFSSVTINHPDSRIRFTLTQNRSTEVSDAVAKELAPFIKQFNLECVNKKVLDDKRNAEVKAKADAAAKLKAESDAKVAAEAKKKADAEAASKKADKEAADKAKLDEKPKVEEKK